MNRGEEGKIKKKAMKEKKEYLEKERKKGIEKEGKIKKKAMKEKKEYLEKERKK